MLSKNMTIMVSNGQVYDKVCRALAQVTISCVYNDVTAYSAIKTVSHVDVNIGEKEPVCVSLGILEFQRLLRVPW